MKRTGFNEEHEAIALAKLLMKNPETVVDSAVIDIREWFEEELQVKEEKQDPYTMSVAMASRLSNEDIEIWDNYEEDSPQCVELFNRLYNQVFAEIDAVTPKWMKGE